MVYDSDFYTTRRPYRASPAYSSYTTSFEPSRQVRILPGLGKVHIVHSYDRIVPYVGHKRLTVVTSRPKVFSTSPSILNREYDWIERRVRPRVGYSATNRYLNSDSAVRIYYSSYPISSSYCSTLSLPSTTYYPKLYRWYYDWPSTYSSYYSYPSTYSSWPSTYYSWRNSYYWPRSYDLPSSYYWPYYRSYLSSFFRNYYLSSLPSLYYKSLDYQFRELENKINNLSIFDTETSLIRAQTSALLKRVHDPVPRAQRFIWPTVRHYSDYELSPAIYGSSNAVQRVLMSSPSSKSSYTTYYTAPERKYIGTGRLSSVSYAGGRAYDRRPHIYLYDNPLQSDIQLLSYYINKFKQEKTYSADSSKASAVLPLSPARATRKFGSKRSTEDDAKQDAEMQKLRDARAARLAFINEEEKLERLSASREVDEAVKAKKEKEDAARLAEERALAEEQARQQALSKEAARKAELARQEELAAQAAAQRAADLERQAELARKEEAKKQAEIDKKKKEDAEEKARLEEQKRLEEAKAEEALQAQLRLEEIARRAEEEREDELARQAEELAELAKQEAALAEQAKREAEEEEERRQEAELEDLRRQEAELAELERQEQELAEAAQQEAEVAEKAKEDAEAARLEAEAQQAELEELERAQAELDALDEEAKAMEAAPAQEEEEEESIVDEAELARQAELEELRRQEEELEELERAQAELDALEEEAKAMASDFGPPVDHNDEEEDDEAIAEGAQSEEGED